MDITVASLLVAKGITCRYDAVISVETPGERRGLRFGRRPHPDHLVLQFEDVDEDLRPGVACATPEQVREAIAFGRRHLSGRLLVHCWAGIARSSALALAIIADRLGAGREDEAVATLRGLCPFAAPNLHVLGLADAELRRGGRLVDAWMAVERASTGHRLHRMMKRLFLGGAKRIIGSRRPSAEGGIMRFPADGGLAPAM
jgi:Predicted protein tyrosine phosphatase